MQEQVGEVDAAMDDMSSMLGDGEEQEQGEGEETALAHSASATAVDTLSPLDHHRLLHATLAELQRASSTHQALQHLSHHLSQTRSSHTLSHSLTQLHNALSLHHFLLSDDSEALQSWAHVLSTHSQATFNSGGSALFAPVFVAASSLALVGSVVACRLNLATLEESEEEEEEHSNAQDYISHALARLCGRARTPAIDHARCLPIETNPIARWTAAPSDVIYHPSGAYSSSTLRAVAVKLYQALAAAHHEQQQGQGDNQAQAQQEYSHLLSEDSTRNYLREMWSRASADVKHSQTLFSFYLTFEKLHLHIDRDRRRAQAEATSEAARVTYSQERLESVQKIYLTRLRSCHTDLDHTFASYTRFVSLYMPANAYEASLSEATSQTSRARALLVELEPLERTITSVEERYWAALRVVLQLHQIVPDASTLGKKADANRIQSAIQELANALEGVAQGWKAYLDRLDKINSSANMQSSASKPKKEKQAAAVAGRETTVLQVPTETLHATLERSLIVLGLPPALSGVCNEQPPTPQWESWNKNLGRVLGKSENKTVRRLLDALRAEMWNKAKKCWVEAVWTLSRPRISPLLAQSLIARAVKALPLSGELWAVQLRQFATSRSRVQVEETFTKVFDGGLFLSVPGNAAAKGEGEGGIEATVQLVLGRMDAERELLAVDLASERGTTVQEALAKSMLWSDTDRWSILYGLLMYYHAIIRQQQQAQEGGGAAGLLGKDEALRLERLATEYCLIGQGTETLAEEIWHDALLDQPNNVAVWSHAAEYRARVGDVKKARSTYKMALARNYAGEREKEKLELMEEWNRFEMCFGTVQEIEVVKARIRQQREVVWKAWYEYAQYQGTNYTQTSTHNVQGTDDAAAPDANSHADGAGRKRKAEDEDAGMDVDAAGPSSMGGLATTGSPSRPGAPQSTSSGRDRENSSVIVSNLPLDCTSAELVRFFRTCGELLDPDLLPRPLPSGTSSGPTSAAAMVEFVDRSSVPAARTRDRKLIGSNEVRVSLGWECTLFVTNFEEGTTDEQIKAAFERFGDIYEVRWPSRRIKASRRFCYVVYAVPEHAEAALALNDQPLNSKQSSAVQVLISDPARKAQRTDAHADKCELFITGLPRAATDEQVRALFTPFGEVTGVRVLRGPNGKPKGLAFVDYKNVLDAHQAVAVLSKLEEDGQPNARINGKPIHVSLAKAAASSTGNALSKRLTPEQCAAAVKVRHLPFDAQEAKIQQLFENVAGGVGSISKVNWTPGAEGQGKAVVVCKDAQTAGLLALRSTLLYDGRPIEFVPLGADFGTAQTSGKSALSAAVRPLPSDKDAPHSFAPRTALGFASRARGRGRGGVGFGAASARGAIAQTKQGSGVKPQDEMSVDAPASAPESAPSQAEAKSQDQFRAMLRK